MRVDQCVVDAEIVGPSPVKDPALRDASDQPVLGTLLAAQAAGGADYLITGDKGLLALASRYPIVTPDQFWRLHGAS